MRGRSVDEKKARGHPNGPGYSKFELDYLRQFFYGKQTATKSVLRVVGQRH